MSSRAYPVAILLSLLLTVAALRLNTAVAEPLPGLAPPLRSTDPTQDIVNDLQRFIPEYMNQKRIPGAAIALIRDGQVAWTEGFGATNTITRGPITPETLFEVASSSKVVTAYIALRLVDQGRLSLDEPLNHYLSEPWLPPSPYRDAITLRHVLSHTSGLGHSTASRESLFAPGEGYSYSAIGFTYLQAVLEEVTGQPLEGSGLGHPAQPPRGCPVAVGSTSTLSECDDYLPGAGLWCSGLYQQRPTQPRGCGRDRAPGAGGRDRAYHAPGDRPGLQLSLGRVGERDLC